MTNERARRLREAAEDAENRTIRAIEESGQLRHLHGKPLDLSDDSPDWLLSKLLKQEGYSHPLIERRKEVEIVRGEVEAVLDRLRQARRRLSRAGFVASREQIMGFNTSRTIALAEYQEGLARLNRTISFHNLGVPEVLHQQHYHVDAAVERAASEIPPIEISLREPHVSRGWTRLFQRFRRRSAPAE